MTITATIPTSAEECEKLLGDPEAVEAFAKAGKLNDLVKGTVTAYAEGQTELLAQIREQSQRVTAQMLTDNGLVPTAPVNLSPLDGLGIGVGPGRPLNRVERRNKLWNQKAPGAGLDKVARDPSTFFQAIWHRAAELPHSGDLSKVRDEIRRVQNAYSSHVPADGGFLIPEALRSEILSVALETAVVRPRARVIPMETLRVGIPAIDSSSHTASVFGGVICYWTEESAALQESGAKFMKVVLEAHKLTAYAVAPNELVADATAFGSFFDQTFPQAMSWFEDDAFMSGDGVGKPLGVRESSAQVTVTKETGQPADTIVWENIVKMYARMLPSSLNSAVWLVPPSAFPELATMALSVGTGGSAIWLNNGADGPPMTILGRPVIVTEKAPALGDEGDIAFVDLGYYLIGDRQIMQASSSEHVRFATDETAFRIISRVDGRPWIQSALTPKNGGDTLSPFVQLGARA